MPSEKILEQKKQLVSDLSEKLKNSVAGVLVSYKGISVADDTKLRSDLRAAGVEELAELPSKEQLVAQVLGGLNAPITGLVYVLNANITGLARVLNAIAEKKGA